MKAQLETLHKRALFEAWLVAHAEHSFAFALAGEALARRRVLSGIAHLTGVQQADEYVYVLMERRAGEDTPAYIGKSRDPLKRWAQHLAALGRGEGRYLRRRQRLFREGHDALRFDLTLFVVGQVKFPPLPGFPAGIAAVEYQLVGLAADACPLPLLNEDGQSR